MKNTLENCWMILPGHTVGYGDIEIEGEAISAVNLKDRTFEHFTSGHPRSHQLPRTYGDDACAGAGERTSSPSLA